MGVAIHILTWLTCLQVAQMFPMQGDLDPAYGDIGMRLAKKHSFNPYKESLFSSLGFYESPRVGAPSQRKKAVDSTFIRFGRSSMPNEGQLDTLPSSSSSNGPYFAEKPNADDNANSPASMEDRMHQEVINSLSNGIPLRPEDCGVTNNRDLLRVLLINRSCLLKKAKRENVNDTFIRFGKREAPDSLQRSSDPVKIGSSVKGLGR